MTKYRPMVDKLDDPWPAVAADRATCPIHHVHDAQVDLYQVLGYPEVEQIVRDPKTFSNRFSATPTAGDISSYGGVGVDGEDNPVMVLSFADPPDHGRQRRLLVAAFSPTRVQALSGLIQAVADDLIDALPQEGGRFELVEGWARLLVIQILAELLGVPPADREKFRRWTQIAEETAGSGQPPTPEQVLEQLEFVAYIGDQIAQRRAAFEPPDDLITGLIRAEDDGARLRPGEVAAMVHLLLAAGNSTTTNNIGNLVYLLETHSKQKQLLLGDLEGLAPRAVEEGLRFDAPIHGLFRTATGRCGIAGVSIPANAQLFVCWGAANHDPRVYHRPDVFDISRDPAAQKPHLAFGMGVHHCIGSNLARMETLIAIKALYGRLPNLRIVDGHSPHQVNSMLFRTWSSVEMEYDGPVRARSSAACGDGQLGNPRRPTESATPS